MQGLEDEDGETLGPVGLGVTAHEQDLDWAEKDEALRHTEADEDGPAKKTQIT